VQPDKQIGHYQIFSLIIDGCVPGHRVYGAHDTRLNRDVVIKEMPESVFENDTAREACRNEMRALAELNHPNIASVYDFYTREHIVGMVMEPISGITLTEKLSTGQLMQNEIVRLGIQLAAGLAAGHDLGIIHEDVTPGNLMVTPDGKLKILSFGWARAFVHNRIPLATPLPYVAPELFSDQPTTIQSDIYSAGAVLYELVTNRRAYPQKEPARVIYAKLHQELEPPRDICRKINPALENMILKAMASNPARRYNHAEQLGADLETLGM
jgi:serine/threonine-protein kinase